MKHLIWVCLFISLPTLVAGQSQSLLYNQKNNPFGLMLNPGMRYQESDFHVSIPALGRIQISASNSAFNLDELFNSQDINQNIEQIISDLGSQDYFQFNQTLDLLNVGLHYKSYYFTAGLYQQSMLSLTYPADVLKLAYFGNTSAPQTYSIEDFAASANYQNVLHFGINKAVNKNLYLGIRAKLYLSNFNLSTQNNTGQFTSRPSTNEPLALDQRISNLDLVVNTAGGNLAENNLSPQDFIIGKNFGLGVDIGMSYTWDQQHEFTASLLDIGFINFSKNTKNYYLNGSYTYDGIQLLFPQFNEGESVIDYYEELDNNFQDSFNDREDKSGYIYWQPTKLNLGYTYQFDKDYPPNCNCAKTKKNLAYKQEVGLHLFMANYPGYIQHQLNGFYQTQLYDPLKLKITAGLSDYKRFNAGIGLTARFNGFLVFMNVDTLRHLNNLYQANDVAVQGGFSLIL